MWLADETLEVTKSQNVLLLTYQAFCWNEPKLVTYFKVLTLILITRMLTPINTICALQRTSSEPKQQPEQPGGGGRDLQNIQDIYL